MSAETPPLRRVGDTAKLIVEFRVMFSPLDDFPPEMERKVGDGAYAAGRAIEEAVQEICWQNRMAVVGFGPLAGTVWGNP